ncbi:MAG: RNB domain-containing ribonuclease [Bacteroidales bacterium]|nr:RNB domain-containing ribonuclease [Bacteroidales bacterium]
MKRNKEKRRAPMQKRRRTSGKTIYPQYVGRVQMTREGFIFVIVEGLEDDVFVKASKTRHALDGDTVRVAVRKPKSSSARSEGEVVEIIERSNRPFVGIYHNVGAQGWVLMQSKSMPYDIEVDAEASAALGAKRGMKVAAVVDSWDRGETNPAGHIVDVLGVPGENETEMHAILAEFNLPYRFEPEVENAADSISEKITPADLKGRKDFRSTLTFTIDPADAKDFDDALSFRPLENGNYEVGVHIADVSYYVKPGSPVDQEARTRGTSVYLVDRTVPMLPENLCNKLCSLRPGEDKLCFSVVFELSPKAEIKSRWIGRTVINSDYRFDYDGAQSIIEAGAGNGSAATVGDPAHGGDAAAARIQPGDVGSAAAVARLHSGDVDCVDPTLTGPPSYVAEGGTVSGVDLATQCSGTVSRVDLTTRCSVTSSAAPSQSTAVPKPLPDCSEELKQAILRLNDMAATLKEKRFKAGAINFDRPEMKVEVDGTGKPVRVYQHWSKEANWLIEEFMLLANRTVAEFIATGGQMNAVQAKNAKTFIYRVHGEPNEEKLQGLRGFADTFGYKMGSTGNGKNAAESLRTLLSEAKGKPEFTAFENLALRSMAKAVYSTENIGHYGLAFKFYTHFTSPIRRYPDTMVHRLLSMYLAGAESQNTDRYEDECKYASARELVAADAERTSVKYKLVEFMQDKIGCEYDGAVSGITEWGMYVETDENHIEGMIPLREIRSDFFDFDESHYCLNGRRTGRKYRLGDRVRIRVKNANLEQRIIDYELIETEIENVQVRTNTEDDGMGHGKLGAFRRPGKRVHRGGRPGKGKKNN